MSSITCFFITAEGRGFRKKDARHDAAKRLLDKLAGLNISYGYYFDIEAASESSKLKVPGEKTSSGVSSNDLKATTLPTLNIQIGNFVGALQDFCAMNKLDNPIYELVGEMSVNNVMQFDFSCTISGLNLSTSETASSKKLAKQRSAEEMWKIVNQQQSD